MLPGQRLGPSLVVPVDPPDHGLVVAPCTPRHARRTALLGDLVERQEALARAGVRSLDSEPSKILRSLVPPAAIDAKHGGDDIPELWPKNYASRGRRGLAAESLRTALCQHNPEALEHWLAERAQRVAAPPRPPVPGRLPSDGRRATRVTLRSDTASAWVGEPVRFSGALSADGGRVARQAVELWLIDPRQPTEGRLLGQTGTDAQGRFVLSVAVPAEVDLRDYDFVARFAGDAALRPADSSW